MSLDATRWAWKQNVKPSQKLVLLSLADRANEENCCFPSVARLENDTCLNRKTIMESIKKLEIMGLISIEKSTGKGNKYQLIGVENRHEIINKPVPKTTPVPKTVLVPETGQQPVPKTGQGSTKNGTGTSPKNGTLIYQSNLSSNLPTESRKYKSIDLENLPDQINAESAKGFIDHRKLIKKPLTQRAFDMAMKEALKAGEVGLTANEIIDRTVMKGWRGIDLSYFKNDQRHSKPQQKQKELAS